MKCFTGKLERKPAFAASNGVSRSFVKCMGWTLPVIVSLTMLGGSMPAAAEKQAQARLQVSAVVLTMIKVKIVSQPSRIEIELKHVSQGYIDIEDASVLLITSNSADGFMMSLTHDPLLVSRVSVRLSESGGTIDGESLIFVRTQQVRDEPMRVSYRLHLNPQAHAGSVPWPVALSFTPRAV